MNKDEKMTVKKLQYVIDEKETYTDIEKQIIVKLMLRAIGENPNREGLIDTPKRVVKMWSEIFRGYDKTQLPKVTTFNNGSDGLVYDEMINDLSTFSSHCEHHMVSFFGSAYFSYIPNPKGKILGLSKVARVIDFFSAKLQVQERLVHEVVEYLYNELSKDTKYKPLGMALVMEGEHLCKTMRGVKKKGMMRTSKLIGAYKTDPATRSEFMSWVDNCKR